VSNRDGSGEDRGSVPINFEGMNLSPKDRETLAEAVRQITRIQGSMYARNDGREIVLNPENDPPRPISEAPSMPDTAH
jgi:hypothetical protein